jgi:uncharacterized protein YbbC (DUF1343 family)
VSRLLALLFVLGCAESGLGRSSVRPGIDVLFADSIDLVAHRRVGLLTNQTGVDRTGTGDLERLLEAGVQVSAIFSPEHGYRGILDRDDIGHGVDSATGIPIYSLYGRVRSPTRDMLATIDVLLIDLQDIGARPYTYISTALGAMRAAQPAGVPVVILDRPNPIGGVAVQGPILDTAFASFVGMLPVALRHGMTLGELALFGNLVLDIRADVTVVPVAGWTRDQWFDDTGLPWVRPSPNMPSLESATHYPGLVLFEGTALSVGRGTTVAFQVIGAPWLRPPEVIAALGTTPGVEVADTTVMPTTPSDGKFDGVPLPSVRLRVLDRGLYDPTATAVALLVAIRSVHPDRLQIDPQRFDRLAGSDELREAVARGEAPTRIAAAWESQRPGFLRLRQRVLVYR